MHVRERSTHRQLGRQTETQRDTQTDRQTNTHRRTDRHIDRHTGNTSTVAMVFGTVQVRSSASPSLRPRWLLVTCSRHSPIPLGLPPSPPPCRSPRSSRWEVCKIEKIYNVCYRDLPILPPPYKSQPRSRWVV